MLAICDASHPLLLFSVPASAMAACAVAVRSQQHSPACRADIAAQLHSAACPQLQHRWCGLRLHGSASASGSVCSLVQQPSRRQCFGSRHQSAWTQHRGVMQRTASVSGDTTLPVVRQSYVHAAFDA